MHLFVADVVKSFDTVDRVSWVWFSAVWDCRPGSVMLILEYHAHVWLRFQLAVGLGEPWTRDGGIPQG